MTHENADWGYICGDCPYIEIQREAHCSKFDKPLEVWNDGSFAQLNICTIQTLHNIIAELDARIDILESNGQEKSNEEQKGDVDE